MIPAGVVAVRTCACVSRYCRHHAALRDTYAPSVMTGMVRCWRCDHLIPPRSPWDLGHDDDDPRLYRGPEHRGCNRATAGRQGAAQGPQWVL